MDFPHLERLSRAECRQLLKSAPVGRLAVPTPQFPTLEPVSFAVIEGELVVAVRPGSAGEAVASGTSVTFEADILDHAFRRGWSVVVSGPVEDLDADVVPLVAPLLGPWPVASGDRLLLIRSDEITGRRIVSGPAPSPGDEPTGALAPSRPAVDTGRPIFARRAIDTDAALALLERGGQHVGRLVLTVSGQPLVFPLNYAVDEGAIVFRTEVGTKLTGITRSLATFEVDHIDDSGEGWAVAFEGLAQEVLDTDSEALRARIAAIALDSWPGGNRPHVVRITPYRVHGTAWTAAAPAPATAARSANQA